MSSIEKKVDRRQFLFSSAGVGMTLGLSALTSRLSVAQESSNKLPKSLPADITDLSASELSNAIKKRQVSCVEVMQAYLQRIDLYNPIYNAIVGIPETDVLLRQAGAADRALDAGEYWGWMHGMPHAVKDLSNVKGMISSRGSPIFKDNVAQHDSIFVERLRAQGAIFIGKTNVPEFGLGSQTYNSVYGTTRNAYDPALIAGGSSGGAAVGLATAMLPVADGSDMMGSLRNPAAYNNVIGFRPSQGRVPHRDSDLFFQQLGYEGPMGRSVEDTIRLLRTMSGYDSRVPLSLRDEVSEFQFTHPRPLHNLKIGWLGDYDGYLPTEPGLMELCKTALQPLTEAGVRIEDCLPEYDMERLWQTWLTLRHWTVCGGSKPLYDNPETRRLLRPEAVWEIEGGLEQTGLELSKAAVARSDWYKGLHNLFEQYDLLALPSAQVFPFSAEIHWPKEVNGKPMDTYHRWMEVTIGGTLSGCPVVNLPAGFDQQQRPMGIQFIGPMGEDSKVLEFALAYEAHTDHLSTKPTLRNNSSKE